VAHSTHQNGAIARRHQHPPFWLMKQIVLVGIELLAPVRFTRNQTAKIASGNSEASPRFP
jgi:hypothetical protein